MNDRIRPKPSGKSSVKIALVLLTACFTLTLLIAARVHARDPGLINRPLSPRSSPSQAEPPAKPSSDMSNMPGMGKTGMPAASSDAAARAVNDDMSDMDMHMNMAHMFMTALRPANAPDQARAAQILVALRPAILKYQDYKVALADGYKIFAPNVPQQIYHFTLRRNALRAQFTFDPARPTSLLYKKVGNGYQLEGAMYTAPRRFTLDQLNQRVPLSVARWHKHVNFCLAPRGIAPAQVDHTKFGFNGSISTEEGCSAAGGRWIPEVFNWMVHVYPYQSDPGKIWAH